MLSDHVIETPAWITTLVEDVVVPAVRPTAFMGQLGYQYWSPDEPENPVRAWQIAVYPTVIKVVSQHPLDGAAVVAGFELNLLKISKELHEVTELYWRSPANDGGGFSGAECSVRGRFAGRDVWLRFYRSPPDDEPPSCAVDARNNAAAELPA